MLKASLWSIHFGCWAIILTVFLVASGCFNIIFSDWVNALPLPYHLMSDYWVSEKIIGS